MGTNKSAPTEAFWELWTFCPTEHWIITVTVPFTVFCFFFFFYICHDFTFTVHKINIRETLIIIIMGNSGHLG